MSSTTTDVEETTISIPTSIKPDSEEYKFLNELLEFHADNDTLSTLQKFPIMNNEPLDLLSLFKLVIDMGGYEEITSGDEQVNHEKWKEIYQKLTRNYNPENVDSSIQQLNEYYLSFLVDYETEHNDQLAVNGYSNILGTVIYPEYSTPSTPPSSSSSSSSKIPPTLVTLKPESQNVMHQAGSTTANSSNVNNNNSNSNSSNNTSSSNNNHITTSVPQNLSSRRNTHQIIFRFYLTKNWLTSRKQFIGEKPPPLIDLPVTLDDNPISHALIRKLPILEHCNKFGEQLVYFTCPNITNGPEVTDFESKTSSEIIPIGSLAYWRAGSSLVLGWGKTPANKAGECRLLEACTVIGKWPFQGAEAEKFISELTTKLGPVSHHMTQIQLKRRIERTADRHKDMEYIIVEVQTADYFSNAQLQANSLHKQVRKIMSPPTPNTPSLGNSIKPLGLPPHKFSPATPPSASSSTTLGIPGLPRAQTVSPTSPATGVNEKALPHPVHNGPPPPMLRGFHPNHPASLLEQKRKQTSEQNQAKQHLATAPHSASRQTESMGMEHLNRPHSPTRSNSMNNTNNTRYPYMIGSSTQIPIQPYPGMQGPTVLYTQPGPGMPIVGQKQHQGPTGRIVNGTKRPTMNTYDDENYEAHSRARKRARQAASAKKIPLPASLPDSLHETKSPRDNSKIYDLIIRYKFKGENDKDYRMIKKCLESLPGEVDTATTKSTTNGNEQQELVLNGGHIVNFLQQDNVDLQDIEEIRFFEEGADEDCSGWVLLENDYKCKLDVASASNSGSTRSISINADEQKSTENSSAATTQTAKPSTPSRTKVVIRLLLKKAVI